MVSSVLQSLPSYSMNCLLLPQWLCNDLDSISRRFWWGVKDGKRGLFLQLWNSLCKPKNQGGMGFRKTRDQNIALVSKMAWRFITEPNTLWVRILRKKYKFTSVHTWLEHKWRGDSSWFYQSLLEVREYIKNGICWSIGEGNSVRIWEDKWVPLQEDFTPKMHPELTQQPEIKWVSELIDPTRREWNRELIGQIFDKRSVENILKMPLARISSSDTMFWAAEGKGKYTVRSCYKMISSSSIDVANVDKLKWKNIWRLPVPERMRHFIWRITSQSIPTKVRIQQIFQIGDSATKCTLCNEAKETLAHLFIECKFASQIWASSEWYTYIKLLIGRHMNEWLEALIFQKEKLHIPEVDCVRFLRFGVVLVDKIWALRNEVGHGGSTMEVEKLARSIEVGAIAIKEVENALETRYKSGCETIKCRLTNDMVILEGDVAVRGTFSIVAVVAKSFTGKLLVACSKKIDDTSVLRGEIGASLLALELALQFGWRNIIIRSDSDLAVEAIQKPEECRDWRWRPMLRDIHSILDKMKQWRVEKINRVANSWAHNVARWAAFNQWIGCIPYLYIPMLESWLVNGLDPPTKFWETAAAS